MLKKIDEEIIEDKKKVTLIIEEKRVKRLRLINVSGTVVIRGNNDINEVRLEHCRLDKLRVLSNTIIVLKDTRIRDGLIVDLSPEKTKRTTTATAPS